MNLSRMRRPGQRARRILVVGMVVAVVGGGYATYAAGADGPSYRLATATVGEVEQTLEVSGSVEPAGRADLAFAASGVIESIDVKAGDTVKAGTRLGELDDTGLRKTLQQARATLATARAQLESDKDAQADTVSSASSSTSTPSTPSTPTDVPADEPSDPTGAPTTPSGGALAEALAALATEQEAVVSAQSAVSASLGAAQDALATQQETCSDAFSTDSGGGPAADPTDGSTADPGAGTDDATNQACSDALAAVQSAQQQVSSDQDALQAALTGLADTLSEAIATLQDSAGETGSDTGGDTGGDAGGDTGDDSGGQTTAPSGSSGTGASSSDTSAATGSGMSDMTTVSAATLARDQATIDDARAQVITARQALRTATVRAPFGGRIMAVDAAEGDSVSSGTEVFVVVAPGMTTIQVKATSDQVQQLEVGQPATARPAGSDRVLAGTVSQISTVPDDSGTYPVTVTLRKRNLDIATGLSASVAVVTGTATDVVTVPASAVSSGSVRVVGDGGSATRARVTTGVVGATTVEIVDGLEAGDQVVLADLEEALPTTDDSDSRNGFGTGSFPGGGSFPAGGVGGFAPPAGGRFPGQ